MSKTCLLSIKSDAVKNKKRCIYECQMGQLGIVNGPIRYRKRPFYYFHSTERLWSMVVLSPQEPVCWIAIPP